MHGQCRHAPGAAAAAVPARAAGDIPLPRRTHAVFCPLPMYFALSVWPCARVLVVLVQ